MRKSLLLLVILALILPLAFLGCEGDDGAQGPPGEKGEQGDPGPPGSGLAAKAESCSVCHGGNPERDGEGHQAIYNMYTDDPTLAVTIDDVVSVDNGTVGFYNVTMTFTIEDLVTGLGLTLAEFEDLDQARFYTTRYDNTTMQFFEPKSFSADSVTDLGGGQFSVVAEGVPYEPEASDAFVYMYVARDELDTEAVGRAHYALYDDVVNVGQAFGDNTYVSAANVEGCEKCHGEPYQKHGYRAAVAAGLPNFVSCKACHYDDRNGGHFDWQILVTDPARFAEIFAGDAFTDAEKIQYAYTANIMNDVHMSHAMEFPYPQSMANCATCHEGKLDDMVLTDANFVLETCKSCHAVTGEGSEKQAPPLDTIIPHVWTEATVCNQCHTSGPTGIAPLFSEIHTGYDEEIYAAPGQKFADAITVSVDNATLVGTDLTIEFSASGAAGGLDSADMAPAVLIGMYGYDTKDFIVNGHDRWDSNCNGTIGRNEDRTVSPAHDRPKGEYVVGEEEAAGCPNVYWTLVSGGPGAGPWVITAHLGAEAEWADMINNGIIKRVEIGILPELENAAGDQVPLNAASRTFVLATGTFDDDFFAHKVVNVDNCNKCHDQLATTFHSGERGGSIVVCRMCHVKLTGGSHLEMQSRSIDSYVHAIHSFQAFDIGDVDFDDPVEATMYQLHIEHLFPNFTTMNCESCHNDADIFGSVPYNVPDQSKSLPGVLSRADQDVVFNNISLDFLANGPRNIGNVPSYIVGPASTACGGCHRAHLINEDKAGELSSLFSHWGSFGSLVTAGDPPNDIYTVIDDIFSAL